jgi:hypothetical protein
MRHLGVGPPVDGAEDERHGQATIVYTLWDGKIVYLHRAEALKAARASVAWD